MKKKKSNRRNYKVIEGCREERERELLRLVIRGELSGDEFDEACNRLTPMGRLRLVEKEKDDK